MDTPCLRRLGLIWVVLSTLQNLTANASNNTATPPPDKPFLESDAFIGLAIGVGAVGGTLVLCCILWKCFCADVDK